MAEGWGDVLEREGIWGVLFCSISEQALFVLNDTMPKEVHVLFLRKMPQLKAITTGFLRHPKWAKNTCLNEYL